MSRNGAPSRLNGWKTIASFLGKSVSTAHRWERDYALPVHRMPTDKGGQIVWAQPDEIDDWMGRQPTEKSAGRQPSAFFRAGLAETDVLTSREADTPRVSQRTAWVTLVSLMLAGLAVVVVPIEYSEKQLAAFEIAGHELILRNSRGRLLWKRVFPLVLTDRTAERSRGVIADLDGDGSQEVVVLMQPAQRADEEIALYVFEHDGELRFRHQVARNVTFGGRVYGGLYPPNLLWVVPERSRGASIWLASNHYDQFPSVLQRIDNKGQVLSEYWSNGHISAFSVITLSGRRCAVVGGTTNEFRSASVAILDYEHPVGSAPASEHKYACGNCPEGAPFVYIVIPKPELWAVYNDFLTVHAITTANVPEPVTIEMAQNVTVPGSAGPISWSARYWLDSAFKFTRAEYGDDYPSAHRTFQRLSGIDHPFTNNDHECELWPVLRWSEGRYLEDWGPSSCASRPSPSWKFAHPRSH